MPLTQRDRFFIKEAFKAGRFFKTPDEWLSEVLNDAGYTMEQSLVCDARQIEGRLTKGRYHY